MKSLWVLTVTTECGIRKNKIEGNFNVFSSNKIDSGSIYWGKKNWEMSGYGGRGWNQEFSIGLNEFAISNRHLIGYCLLNWHWINVSLRGIVHLYKLRNQQCTGWSYLRGEYRCKSKENSGKILEALQHLTLGKKRESGKRQEVLCLCGIRRTRTE